MEFKTTSPPKPPELLSELWGKIFVLLDLQGTFQTIPTGKGNMRNQYVRF
jgi:hypothetical protein